MTRHPRGVLAVVLVISLCAAAALVRSDPIGLALSIDPSTEPLLPRGDPAQVSYRRAVLDFGDDEVYVIAMQTDGVFNVKDLHALQSLGHELLRLPGVVSVRSLADVTAFRYDATEDWIEVRPFIEDVPEDPAVLLELRSQALQNPLYRDTLVSADGKTAALNVSFRKMTDREFIEQGLDERIEAILAGAETETRQFHVAGRPHVKARVYQTMVHDLRLLIPAGVLVLALVLAMVTGTWRGVLLPLGMVLLATGWTFAVMAWLERPLSVLTTLLAPTLIAVGSVYGVHVLARFEEEVRQQPDPAQAAQSTLRKTRLPVLIAGVTTMIGFGALMISDVPAVFELGALSVFGVAAVTLLSLSALPACLALLPAAGLERRAPWSAKVTDALDAALRRLAATVARRRNLALSVWAGLTLGSLALIPRIEIDTDFLSFFSRDAPVRQEFEKVNELLSGAVPVYLPLVGEASGTFREPETLRAIELLQDELAATPGVSHVAGMVDTLRRLNRAFEADDPQQERIPDTRRGVAQLLNLVPKGELQRFVNIAHSRANLVVRTGEVGSASIRELESRLNDALARHELPGVSEKTVTGNTLLLAHSADGIAAGQPRSVGLAALAMFLLVSLSFRSWRLGALAMVPNVVPVVIFFGLLGTGIAPLSLPTSLIGATTLGIAIDGTVHYLVRYRRERESGASPERAAQAAGLYVGRPIALGTGMLCLGFAVVALSGFATLQQFGLLASSTMAICLASDLILLPALLQRFQL